MKRHWEHKDFVITIQNEAYDGKGGTNDFGYCLICKGDMQRFATNGQPGPIQHHNSHKHAKRAGAWH